jgi:hypothetical protein
VNSGQVTLDYAASKVHIGLPYDADLETLEPPIEQTQGKRKRVSELKVGVLRSRGMWAGCNKECQVELKQREFEAWGEPTDLVTGYVDITVEPTYENLGQLVISQRDPLPLTILAVIPDYDVGD